MKVCVKRCISHFSDPSSWHIYEANFYKFETEFDPKIFENMELPQKVGVMPGTEGEYK